jgi:CopG family nickel-responsive transcriptional regulator
VGILALLFDHERAGLTRKITQIFHQHVAHTVASLHVHVTGRLCLEVVVLRGRAPDLRTLGAQVRAMKGVLLGDLILVPAEGLTKEIGP